MHQASLGRSRRFDSRAGIEVSESLVSGYEVIMSCVITEPWSPARHTLRPVWGKQGEQTLHQGACGAENNIQGRINIV